MLNVLLFIKKHKKALGITFGILIYSTALFVGGYSCAGNNLDEAGIAERTRLIREQAITIEDLRGQISSLIDQSGIIIDEGEDIETGLGEITDTTREVADGLQSDITGLSGVIDRLSYYEEKGKAVAEDNIDQ